MSYQVQNILGTFLFDENNRSLEELKIKRKELPLLPTERWPQALALFKDKKYYAQFYQKNLELTKKALKGAVSEDLLIIQTIANIQELDKITNLLTKRLREWYSWYLPELSEKITAHEKFVQLVTEKSKEELLQELGEKESMGGEISLTHVEEMKLLAQEILELYQLRQRHELYLEGVMKVYCPNFLELAGVNIGAKLLELGKSLKHLAMLPASTIQLLGAEKALFRHIKTGARSPKYGVIINHPLVQKAPRELKGKAARILADKLSLCARLDYFKGEFKAPEYKRELEQTLRGK